MATVSNTLALLDSFSGPIRAVNDSVNLANSALERLANTANRNVNLDASMEAARSSGLEVNAGLVQITHTLDEMRIRQDVFNTTLNETNTGITQITRTLDTMKNKQDAYNSTLNKAVPSGNKLLSTIKSIGAAYLDWQTAKQVGQMAIGGAMEQQKMTDMFIARTGDARIGTAMFEKFKADALKAGQDVNKSLQSTLSFFSATQNVDQLSKLNNLAQRMSAFDSAGNGIEGAAFALKEAMSGDIVSLAERFNMSKADIRAFKIDELGKKGDMDGFIKAFDQLLEKQKMGQKAFNQMMKSPVKQFEIFKNNMVSKMADAGKGAMTALQPLIVLVNQAFESGKFDGFFNALNTGLSLVAEGLSWVVKGVLWVFNVVEKYWPALVGMLSALGLIYLPIITANILAQAAAWVVTYWPILLVVGVVGLLIGILLKCGVTAGKIVGFIGGIFGTLYAFIYNQIARLWNAFATYASFLANLFIDPVYAIKKLFYDLAQDSLKYTRSMISGLEALINLIPGVKLDFTSKLDKYVKSMKKPTSDKKVIDFQRMDYIDLADGAKKGFALGAKLSKGIQTGIESLGDSFNFDSWNNSSPNIGKVGEVGKIKDTVDISSEDLKVMRDLAEMKNIQNFVTLQPTFNVKTGDIDNRNGEDFESMLDKMTRTLNEQFVSSVEGVYT